MISQLQVSKDISGGTDDVVSVLQEQVRSQQEKITDLADEVDRYRRNLKEKEAILAAREKVNVFFKLFSLELIDVLNSVLSFF